MAKPYFVTKRLIDLFVSFISILCLSPLFLVIAVWVRLDSPGPAIFAQERVGLHGRLFRIYKFRTMVPEAERIGKPITVGQDARITRAGRHLRKWKLDELPQLWNVLIGDMSLIGPRPEVPRYVQLYDETQRKVLTIRPGITDFASIKYAEENDLLARQTNAEAYYIQQVMPDKLQMNLEYVERASFKLDVQILFETLWTLLFSREHQVYGSKFSLPFGHRSRMMFLGVIDTGLVTLSVMTAYLLRFEFRLPRDVLQVLPLIIFLHVLTTLYQFYRSKLYHRVLQYASIGELVTIIKATFISELICIVLAALIHLSQNDWMIQPSIFPLSWLFIIATVGGSRFAWRIFRDTFLLNETAEAGQKVLIIGAGSAGVMLARNLLFSPVSQWKPVAFIDDDPNKHRMQLVGLPVIGGREKIGSAVEQLGVKTIIVAMPSVSKGEIAKILELCKKAKASIKILPSVTDWINGKLAIQQLRPVRVEDLLGREVIQEDLVEVAAYLTGQVVLVTGAGGSIGKELCRQIARFKPKKLLLLGQGENSIFEAEMELRSLVPGLVTESVIASVQDQQRIREVFARYQPAVVFHAAAHKHVPLMERHPAEAVKNNILGTFHVAQAAHEWKATHFVLISTDKAVNPTSVMGATKRVAEMIVQGMSSMSQTNFVVVRFGNVLGSRGSVIPVFQNQIEKGGPVTVTHPEMIRYFMTIPEAAQLVIQAGGLANGGEVFILDMGEPVKIADLARDMIRLYGLEPDQDIRIVYTGIRSGEKLYEELLTNEEGISATRHNRIFVGQPIPINWYELQLYILQLQEWVHSSLGAHPSLEIKRLLQEVVPSYSFSQESPPVIHTG